MPAPLSPFLITMLLLLRSSFRAKISLGVRFGLNLLLCSLLIFVLRVLQNWVICGLSILGQNLELVCTMLLLLVDTLP